MIAFIVDQGSLAVEIRSPQHVHYYDCRNLEHATCQFAGIAFFCDTQDPTTLRCTIVCDLSTALHKLLLRLAPRRTLVSSPRELLICSQHLLSTPQQQFDPGHDYIEKDVPPLSCCITLARMHLCHSTAVKILISTLNTLNPLPTPPCAAFTHPFQATPRLD